MLDAFVILYKDRLELGLELELKLEFEYLLKYIIHTCIDRYLLHENVREAINLNIV